MEALRVLAAAAATAVLAFATWGILACELGGETRPTLRRVVEVVLPAVGLGVLVGVAWTAVR
jgi:hypothetical protein